MNRRRSNQYSAHREPLAPDVKQVTPNSQVFGLRSGQSHQTERRVMGKGQIAFYLKQMSAEDQCSFNRWLKANAILGSIFTAGIIAMAVAGSMSAGPRDAAVASSTSASGGAMPEARRRPMGGVVTTQEPKIRQKLF
jgi:hypothetical protein